MSERRGPRNVSDSDVRTVVDPRREPAGRVTQPIGGGKPAPAQAALPAQQPSPKQTSQLIPTSDAASRIQVYRHPRKPNDPRLVLVNDPDSQRAASFRVLRHRLLERGAIRTIVVSSALPKEGKTTCAANLAIALGECERARVLLLECNMRAPALSGVFGFVPPECFAKQLVRHREQPLDPWTVVEVCQPWLHVAAIHPETASTPLLDGLAFEIAIERLRLGSYDFIVIDGPPVLGAADVNLMQDAVDGVLLTTWARRSRASELRRASEQLGNRKLAGVVMLDI
jgi:Mrp family chromosome partitioning ATPase